jgi:hypothetical protein
MCIKDRENRPERPPGRGQSDRVLLELQVVLYCDKAQGVDVFTPHYCTLAPTISHGLLDPQIISNIVSIASGYAAQEVNRCASRLRM